MQVYKLLIRFRNMIKTVWCFTDLSTQKKVSKSTLDGNTF